MGEFFNPQEAPAEVTAATEPTEAVVPTEPAVPKIGDTWRPEFANYVPPAAPPPPTAAEAPTEAETPTDDTHLDQLIGRAGIRTPTPHYKPKQRR
jgi:hypothetical protein